MTSTDTTLILVPGLRPPVPPRPERLGKRRPAAGHARRARRALRAAENTAAAVLVLTGIGLAVAMASPAGLLVGAWFLGQAYIALTPPAVEVPRV